MSCSTPTARRCRTRQRCSPRCSGSDPTRSAAGRRRDTIFMQQGITFEVAGQRRRAAATGRSRSTSCRGSSRRPSGRTIKRGLAQRIRALNAFVDDVYHAHEIVRAGIVPWSLIVSRPSFARPVHGVRAARRRVLPRCGLRPRPRRRRQLARARGQRPHAVGDLLRAREPDRDDASRCPSCSPATASAPVDNYPSLLLDALRAVAPGGRGRGDRRAVDAGAAQQRVLRARVPRAADGDRARRGVRPRRPRRRLLHAHDQRAPARPRDLPAARRRLHRSARVPPRFAARGPGPRARLPRRHGRDRQRDRHRRRRRQGRLPLRPGDDPLLPERGADPRERPDLSADRPSALRSTCSNACTSWSSSRPPSPAARACSSARRRAPRSCEHAGAADRATSPSGSSRRNSSTSQRSPTESRGWPAGAAPRRPAPVRRVRRGDPDRPRRPDPRRAEARAR